MLAAFGIVAVALISISDISYVRAIIRKDARPQRSTWLIFSMSALVVFVSQASLGASASLAVFGWFALVNTTIFLLSLSRGRGTGGIDMPNTISLAIALASIGTWYWLSSPLAALACILTADTIAIGLSLVKTWRDPNTETLMMWGLGSVAAMFSVLSVGVSADWYLYLAPLHLLVCDVAMTSIILLRRGKEPLSPE